MKLRLHPEAEQELHDAAKYYDRSREGLGDELLAEVADYLEQVRRHPESFSLVQGQRVLRRAELDRFPYLLIYRPGEDEVFVFAVAHDRRRPGYWAHRLDDV